MPVKKDASGRHSVEVETEVPGTPEEVWQAIATGPGISAWFVPTRLEEREGGAIVLDFGPGMESEAVITAWDPPRRFVGENKGGMGPGSPTVADEWTVEAKSGGTCRVRVVHSWFASTDDWDNQFEGVAHLLPVTMGGQVCLSVRLFLYGTQARAVAAREAPVWQAWINGLLPPADAATESEATKA